MMRALAVLLLTPGIALAQPTNAVPIPVPIEQGGTAATTASAAAVNIACTGDGTLPIIGTSVTIPAVGQYMQWPSVPGGQMPTSAVQCIATTPAIIATEAH